MTRRTRLAARFLAGSIAVGSFACMAAPALAQAPKPNERTAPVPAPPSTPPKFYIGLAGAFVLGALVVGVNFIPSKRSHQD